VDDEYVYELEEKVAQLEANLLKYGKHIVDCLAGYWFQPAGPEECTCGWEAIKKVLGGE